MSTQVLQQAEFNGHPLPILRIDDDAWLTSEGIGRALEYNEPRKSINDIYRRHQAELEDYSSVRKLPTDNLGPRETRVFNEEGVMIITMLSRQPRAAEFRRWAVGVLKAYRREALAAPQEITIDAQEITIEQQEYIELLKTKIELLELRLAPQRVRLTDDEKTTIRRLYEMGWDAGNIAQRIGRDKSTIVSHIRNKLEVQS